jgi:hypothetical protein
MIPVTYEPMEGVSVDVQDHTRRTGTHGEMISLDLHGAEEPTRWMLRAQQGAEIGQRGLHQRRGHSIQAPWGCSLSTGTLALEIP